MKQVEFTFRTLRELERLTESIKQFCNPDAVILFGEYVNGTLRNARGGYELLILTDKESSASGEEIHDQLFVDVKYRNRYERKLTVYTYRSDIFMQELSGNYFFYMIYREGHLLYSNDSVPLDKKVKFRNKVFSKRIIKFTENHLDQGERYLQVAHDAIKNLSPKTASVNLFLAMEQYLFTIEYSYFGFRHTLASYYELLMWIKHTSRPFLEWVDNYMPNINHRIRLLEKMVRHARFNLDFSYPQRHLIESYDLICEMKDIIEPECRDRLKYYEELNCQ
ncbi:MAG: hypothetical protein LIO79_08895 [Rikenellaceae bacterium]|nr:hypothetical protein [Rikenellaceae bacterium]